MSWESIDRIRGSAAADSPVLSVYLNLSPAIRERRRARCHSGVGGGGGSSLRPKLTSRARASSSSRPAGSLADPFGGVPEWIPRRVLPDQRTLHVRQLMERS